MLNSTLFETTDDNPARLVDSSTCVDILHPQLCHPRSCDLLISISFLVHKFLCSSKTNFSEMEGFRLSMQRVKKYISF